MQVYLNREGKESGPYLVFQVKEMIDRGELLLSTLAWHQGMTGWQPLAELGAFADLQTKPQPSPAVDKTEPATVSGERGSEAEDLANLDQIPVAGRPRVILLRSLSWTETLVEVALPRVLARLIDLWIGWLIPAVIGLMTGLIPLWQLGSQNYLALQMLAVACLWIFAESWFLKRYGTTPGKWVFGLRVIADASPQSVQIPAKLAFDRSVSVWWRGWCLGLGVLCMFVMGVFSLQSLKQTSRTPWDLIYRTRVDAYRVRIFAGLLAFGLMFVTVFSLRGVAILTPPPADHPAHTAWKQEQARTQALTQQILEKLGLPAPPTLSPSTEGAATPTVPAAPPAPPPSSPAP